MQEKRISLKKKAKVNVDYVKQLEGDSRFQEMLEDTDFKIDKNTDEYRARKTTEGKRNLPSEDEEEPEKPVDLNNLFAGQVDSDDDEQEQTAFEKRISNKSKKIKKPKDKILTGMRQLTPTKKHKHPKKGDVGENSMIAKLKSKRIAISRKQLI